MLQISSLLPNGIKLEKHTAPVVSNQRRNMYRSLDTIPKWSIFCFHLRSILIGLWILVKWSFQFFWSILSQSSRRSSTNAASASDFYGCLHDKPPPCLVDNSIGLQSYVKLKVSDETGGLTSATAQRVSFVSFRVGHEAALHRGGQSERPVHPAAARIPGLLAGLALSSE